MTDLLRALNYEEQTLLLRGSRWDDFQSWWIVEAVTFCKLNKIIVGSQNAKYIKRYDESVDRDVLINDIKYERMSNACDIRWES